MGHGTVKLSWIADWFLGRETQWTELKEPSA